MRFYDNFCNKIPKPVPEYDFEANFEKSKSKNPSKNVRYFITIKKKTERVSLTYLYKHCIYFLQYYC